MGLGALALAIGRIAEEDCGRSFLAPGTAITHMRPEPAGLGGAAPRLQHRHRRVIPVQVAGFNVAAGLCAAQQVVVGSAHTLSADGNGRVVAWGSDSVGQLASGKSLYFETPRVIAGLPPIKALSAQHQWVWAIDREGNLWNWGYYAAEQRSTSLRAVPGRVLGLGGIVQVSAGTFTALVLDKKGQVWRINALGIGSATRLEMLDGATYVSAGTTDGVVVRSDGAVLQVGGVNEGQLAAGVIPDLSAAHAVQGLPAMKVAQVVSGYGYAGLDQAGAVWIWGCWFVEPCAQAKAGAPRKIDPPPAKVVSIWSEQGYVHAVLESGEVWSLRPSIAIMGSQPAAFTRENAFTQSVAFVTGTGSSYSIRSDGGLDALGRNGSGELGIGRITGDATAPQRVLNASGIVAVAAGQFVAYAVRQDGAVLGWGSDYSGSISGEPRFSQTLPRTVALPAGITVSRIGAGARSSYVVASDGSVYGWGENFYSNLGLANVTEISTVTPLPITGVTEIDGGVSWTVAVKKDGTVWRNSGPYIPQFGQVPGFAQEPGISNARRVAVPKHLDNYGAGADMAFVLDGAGTLHGFGYDANRLGILGVDLPLGTYRSAAPIPGIPRPVADFSALYRHVAVVLDDGTVWTWGSNSDGQLGDGTTTTRTQPRQVPGLSGVARVSAGRCHTLALKSDGTVWAWGCNYWGQLGNGTTASSPVPVQVTRLDSITAIRAGMGTSYAIRAGGLLFAWGASGYADDYTGGTLGDGAVVSRTDPVLVLREDGLGNADREDWFLDLDAAAANNRPAFTNRSITTNTRAASTDGATTLNAAVIPRFADLGKSVGIYVVARVQPDFLAKVGAEPRPGTPAYEIVRKAREKGGPIVVNLTPQGWVTTTGQLIAVASGVLSASSGAANILDGVKISGGSFCIGYGDSAASMLSTGSLGEVLNLDGAVSSSGGLPCLLPGTYLSGPAASRVGSPVTFTATVIGGFPTGTVQLTDWSQNLGGSLALTARSEATATAAFTTSALAAGTHSIGGSYSGDAQNASSSVATPLLHQVFATPSGSIAEITGPASSVPGDTVVFSVRVAGSGPTGSVTLQDGGQPIATASLVEGRAALRASALSLGTHSINALYSGDGSNTAATSNVIEHTVVASIVSAVTLSSTPNPSASGAQVTLTAVVSGISPTGTVSFRDGASLLGSAAVAGGRASLLVSGLAPGLHLLSAEYGGDAINARVSSGTIAHQVSAAAVSATPRAFAFTARNNVAPGSLLVSNAIVVEGIGDRVPVIVTGGAYSVGCGATFTETPATIGPGETVCVRHTAAADMGAATYTTLTISGVSATFTSTTYSRALRDGIASLVASYYQSILGRTADAGGQAHWEGEALRLAALDANVSEAFYALAMTFFRSAEYLALRRGDAEYVADMYRTFFSREPDAAGSAHWVGQIASGMPREAALNTFLFSAEFAVRMRDLLGSSTARAEVDTVFDFYRGLLARLPDSAGLAYWVQQFRAAQCAGGGAEAIRSLADSISGQFAAGAEYAARNRTNAEYVSDLYNAFLRRGGDLAGVLFWISELDKGARTRDQVRDEFLASPEFSIRIQGVVGQGCSG